MDTLCFLCLLLFQIFRAPASQPRINAWPQAG